MEIKPPQTDDLESNDRKSRRDWNEENEMVYDDAGNIYFDPTGRLRDKNDKGFSLPKLPAARESVRLSMFDVIRKLLNNDEMPAANRTYARLRAEGAGDMEARFLLAKVWLEEMTYVMRNNTKSDESRLSAELDKLKPHERDKSGRVPR